MRFLLDTNIFLWAMAEDYKLNSRAQKILKASSSELYFSAAGSWEIAIKFAAGSLPLPKAPSEYIPNALRLWAVRSLDITYEHALRAGQLPPHHRDPFDRMLIAQAISERMTVLTADRAFQKYNVDLIYCGR
jgi:PIN domain nuclease of toxin-antitoxin system